MKQTAQFVVDNVRYRVNEYEMDIGFPLMGTLVKMFGKTAINLMIEGFAALKEFGDFKTIKEKIDQGLSVEEVMKSMDKEKLSEAITAFIDRIEPMQLYPLAIDILSTTHCTKLDGKTIGLLDIKSDLKGKYGTVLKLCRLVIKYQFSDVFPELFGGGSESPENNPQAAPAKTVSSARVMAR